MRKRKRIKIKFGTYIIFLIIIAFCIYLYARYIGTRGLEIREYAVTNELISESFDGFKIVHFSDVHYGMTTFNNELATMVSTINRLRPDIVVFSGDFIDYNYKLSEKEKNNIIASLLRIDASLGLYAVYGNHDQNINYKDIMEQSNIQLLKNENIKIYNGSEDYINLIGFDDYLEGNLDISSATENVNYNVYTILLSHEPDVINKLSTIPNLILSGHSHNGQVRFPFVGSIYHVNGAKQYFDEEYDLNGSKLFISGGVGTSKYKIRFLNKPSINYYRLYTR